MGRPVVLSNGKLFVALNEDGLVHDFYYPYVGLQNLTNARSKSHKIGLWVDGLFSWVDDGTWKSSVDFEPEALISKISMYSSKLNISLISNDFVDTEDTAFIRHIEIINHADSERDIRLFMHQVFEISANGRGDTAMYVPESHHILTYKGRKCLVAGGQLDGKHGFDQFAVGNYDVEGKSGTFMDAEDGELSNNLVEHGGVDSVIRFQKVVGAGQHMLVDYWVAVGSDHQAATNIHKELLATSMSERIQNTREVFVKWLAPALVRIDHVKEPYKTAITKGLLVIKAHSDNHGSILASGDSSIFNYGRDYYCYCWPRDAVYALWPLIRLGIYTEAKMFFDFAKGTIHPDGYMLHKYQPDRAIGSTWHSLLQDGIPELAIQEDETACVLFMMWEYYEASQDRELIEDYYDDLIKPAANFLTNFTDEQTGLPHASYDLWEEKFLTSTYSVSMTIAGLDAAAKIAELLNCPTEQQLWESKANEFRTNLVTLFSPDGYFRKGFHLLESGDLKFDDTVDISSLYGVYMLAGIHHQNDKLIDSAHATEDKLLNSSPIGGVIRYQNDNYFRKNKEFSGNPWIVATMWLAQYYNGSGDSKKAQELVNWTIDRSVPSGLLGEQFDPENGECIGVMPLVWSHAELINTILDINKI